MGQRRQVLGGGRDKVGWLCVGTYHTHLLSRVRCTKNFAAWEAQWPAELKKIRVVYAYFSAVDAAIAGEFMYDIVLNEYKGEVTLVVCIKTRGGCLVPHILSIHGLGIESCFEGEDSKVPIYAWALNTCSGQAQLSLLVGLE